MDNYFIGEKQIAVVEVLEAKTPSQNEMVKVTYVDGSFEEMSKMRLELISTEEVSDASGVQKTINSKVSAHLFGVLHEFGIKYGEVEGILNATAALLDSGYIKARDLKFGFSQDKLPLIEINNILLENYAKTHSDGTAPTGDQPDNGDTQ